MKKILPLALLILIGSTFSNHAQLSGIVNTYFKVTALPGLNVVTVVNSLGMKVGDQVILIQMNAAVPPYGNSGNYELCQVAAIVGNNITMTAPIGRAYTPVGNNVQLVKVYRQVNPIITGLTTCAAYNAAIGTGGVLALNTCNTTLTLQANIDVTGKGFTGATAPFANPNGAGTDPLVNGGNGFGGLAGAPGGGFGAAPGGGGGGGGIGGGGGSGIGGPSGGGGGVAAPGGGALAAGGNAVGLGTYTLITNKVYMGGGGGYEQDKNAGGNGGNGGGIIFLMTNGIATNNGSNIIADGNPSNFNCPSGNGLLMDHFGGGGGGQILIHNTGPYTGVFNIDAKGGNSNSCLEYAGGGGGGGIWTSNAIPINVTTSIAGGVSINTPVGTNVNGGNGLVVAGTLVLAGVTTGGACNVLPVEMLYFDGSLLGNTIAIDWATASEIESDYFIVERSVNGNSFIPIARKRAAGNTNEITEYRHIDNKIPKNARTLYYRLNQFDVNGANELSETILVKIPFSGSTMTVSPLVENNKAYVNIACENSCNANIMIYDETGRLISKQDVRLAIGENNNEVDGWTNLAHGVYLVQVISSDHQEHVRLIKD